VSNSFARAGLVAVIGAAVVVAGMPSGTAATATASAPISPRIVAHFDLAAGQTPENAVVEPDGSTDVTFAMANQVAHVGRDGKVRILAQLPRSGQCAIFPGPATLGIARAHDGTLFVVECSGGASTGVWRLRDGSAPVQIAELSPGGLPNGMALDERSGELFVADSNLGEVWRVPTRGGAPSVWAAGPLLRKVSFAGANGLALNNGALWVGNLDQGVIVRIPIRGDGTAGAIQTEVSGLSGGLDDFSVIGPEDTIVAALNVANQVVLVKPGAAPRVLLTAADGLSTPTAVRVHGDDLYVTSAAYFTSTDPNLLVAHINR
jgi:hypothetical protein